jgi:hypothetical protein
MDRRVDTIAMRVFCALMGIGCLALVFMASAAIASGGYRPERYAGGFDPVRTGMLVSFCSMAAGFGLVAAAGITARWTNANSVSLGNIAFWGGLAIGAVATVVIVADSPASSAPLVVPAPLRVMLWMGLGLTFGGMLVDGAADALRRRDPRFLVGLVLLALFLYWRFAARG